MSGLSFWSRSLATYCISSAVWQWAKKTWGPSPTGGEPPSLSSRNPTYIPPASRRNIWWCLYIWSSNLYHPHQCPPWESNWDNAPWQCVQGNNNSHNRWYNVAGEMRRVLDRTAGIGACFYHRMGGFKKIHTPLIFHNMNPPPCSPTVNSPYEPHFAVTNLCIWPQP